MATRIGLGLGDFPFSGPAAYWRWVDLCEAGGVDSLWQSDRLVASAPYLDCLSAMAALAGATKRLKFGMNVLALGLREPLLVAKACATIDYLSEGRLLPAFGVGGLGSPDWAAIGMPPKGRGARTDAALEIMLRLWRGETVDAEGPHFRFQGARVLPLPVQQPLPLWLGGSSAAAVSRTARFGSGWLAGVETPAEVAPIVAAIKAEAASTGRAIDSDHFGAGFFYRLGPADDTVADGQRAKLRRLFPSLGPERLMVIG